MALAPLCSLLLAGCHEQAPPMLPEIKSSPQISGALGLDPAVEITSGIGGAYTVLPRGGYVPNLGYLEPPFTDLLSWEITTPQPTGIVVPAGAPVRVIATGLVTYQATSTLHAWCALLPQMRQCVDPRFADGTLAPYGFSSSDYRTGYVTASWGEGSSVIVPEDSTLLVWSGEVPAAHGELHIGRTSCCAGYELSGDGYSPLQLFSGRWIITVQAEDGSDERFRNPKVWVSSPSTRAVTADSITAELRTATGEDAKEIVWYYIPDRFNTWDGTPPTGEAGASASRSSPATAVARSGAAADTRRTLHSPGADGLWHSSDGRRPEAFPFASQHTVMGSVRGHANVRKQGYAATTAPQPIESCAGQSRCRMAVSQPGSILVVARLGDGRLYSATNNRPGATFCPAPGGGLGTRRSALRADGNDGCQTTSLLLTCNGAREQVTLTRGEEIQCETKTEPSSAPGSLTVTGWQFSAENFTYPDADAGDYVPTETTWRGEMAMSGTVTVKAEVNGVDQTASVSVTVVPREEFKKKQVQVGIRAGTLADVPKDYRPSDPPQDVTDLGRAMTNPGISGYEPSKNLAEVLRTVAMIQDEGPNHGLAYLKEVPMQPQAIVVIHPALTRGSAFYRAQPQTSNVAHGTQPCVQSRWDTYVRLVEEHEGLHGNPNSHVGAFQAALNPAAAEAVEHVVGRTDDLAAMAREWMQLLAPVGERATQQSSNEVFHSTSGGRVRFGCEFNFNVRGR